MIPRLLLGGLRDFPVEEVGVLPLPFAILFGLTGLTPNFAINFVVKLLLHNK